MYILIKANMRSCKLSLSLLYNVKLYAAYMYMSERNLLLVYYRRAEASPYPVSELTLPVKA